MKIDKALLEEYGLILLKLKMFPYFDIAHYVLMCYHVREDIHQHQPCKINFWNLITKNKPILLFNIDYSHF